MKILLSIQPKFIEKIISKEKCFEFRKTIPKRKGVDTIIIYATMPVGKIVGEFKIDYILSQNPIELWNNTKDYSGISKDFFDNYFKNKTLAHAIKIKDLKIYNEKKI